MLLDNAERDGQPQAYTLAFLFGSEEGLEDMRQDFFAEYPVPRR